MIPPVSPKIDLYFYRNAGGNEPVREWLKGLPEDQRREIGLDLQRVQYRWPIGISLADWNAVVPGNGQWPLGSTDVFARRYYRQGAHLLSRG